MPSDTAWTNAQITQLHQLWDEGHSTAEIGRRMGVSKNAVVGKAHRLDLPSRPTPIRRDPTGSTAPRKRLAPRSHGPTLPALTSLAPGAVDAATTVTRRTNASQDELTPVAPPKRAMTDKKHRCCWPCGTPRTPTFYYCDAPTVIGKPYCEEHAARAYRPARKDLEVLALS